MPNGSFNVSTAITPVRLFAQVDIAGQYSMGLSNNGIGGSLTLSAFSLTLDSIETKNGDRVLLSNQTAAGQNGIYVVSNVGIPGVGVVLTRANDFQCIEQLHAGQTISIQEGAISGGGISVVELPLPGIFLILMVNQNI